MPTNDQIKAMIERMRNFDFMGDSDFEVVVFSRDQNAPFEAAAMLRELLAEREWRDMDSAPKDGRFILIYSPDEFDGKQITIRCWARGNWGPGMSSEAWADQFMQIRPYDAFTKWLPLPTPETGEQ